MPPTDGDPSGDKVYVVTGPTSGIGHRTALELARHATVVLVGRDRGKLDDVQTCRACGAPPRRSSNSAFP